MDYQKIAVFLIGNATQDAEIKQARESGNQYGDFRLAVRNRQSETNYFPVRCFGKLAEGLSAIQKGTRVFVEGDLEISAFTGEDGEKRMTFRVLANTYRILGNGRAAVAGEVIEAG
jgi:single stranded DNA-binding protein